jgi:hypothetical protein
VVNSTIAIEEGRYKNVNTVGVSVIAAVRNAVRPLEVPYVFGGDGALVCVPDRFAVEVRRAVAATIAMSRETFGLALRACLVPIGHIRGLGLDISVARHRVSEHYVQCALHGGGPEYVERGLECRWSEIPSPQDETVAMIVDAVGSPDETLPVYRAVMERIRLVYGEPAECRPVERKGLSARALSARKWRATWTRFAPKADSSTECTSPARRS